MKSSFLDAFNHVACMHTYFIFPGISLSYSESTSYYKTYRSLKCKQTVCLRSDLNSSLNDASLFLDSFLPHNETEMRYMHRLNKRFDSWRVLAIYFASNCSLKDLKLFVQWLMRPELGRSMKIHCLVRKVEKLNTRVKTIPGSEAKVYSKPSDGKHGLREKLVKFSTRNKHKGRDKGQCN